MKNTQNITIVLLAVSAAILAGLLAGTCGLERSAQAGNSSVSGGDYIMVPYTWSDSLDLLVVVDVANRKMNVYFPNKTTKALDPIQPTVDLERAFAD